MKRTKKFVCMKKGDKLLIGDSVLIEAMKGESPLRLMIEADATDKHTHIPAPKVDDVQDSPCRS
jgi:hypothetical protein